MNDVRRARRLSWFVLIVPSLFGAGCNREEPAPANPSTSQPKSAQTPRPSKAPPTPATSISPAALKEEPPPRGLAGEWIDAKLYRIRVGRVFRCDEAPAKAATGSVRLGIEVEIAARSNNVFVAPRDVALANEGVIVNSVRATTAPKTCQPLFQPTMLQEGKSASGVVLFDAPDIAFARTASVTYQPARWGGAPLAQVKLPACLDQCQGAKQP